MPWGQILPQDKADNQAIASLYWDSLMDRTYMNLIQKYDRSTVGAGGTKYFRFKASKASKNQNNFGLSAIVGRREPRVDGVHHQRRMDISFSFILGFQRKKCSFHS